MFKVSIQKKRSAWDEGSSDDNCNDRGMANNAMQVDQLYM